MPVTFCSEDQWPALMQNVEYPVFAKQADWRDEGEYRLFVASDSQEDLYVPIDSGVIVGLVLGPCFDVANIGEVDTFAWHFGHLMSCTRAVLGQRVSSPAPCEIRVTQACSEALTVRPFQLDSTRSEGTEAIRH